MDTHIPREIVWDKVDECLCPLCREEMSFRTQNPDFWHSCRAPRESDYTSEYFGYIVDNQIICQDCMESGTR